MRRLFHRAVFYGLLVLFAFSVSALFDLDAYQVAFWVFAVAGFAWVLWPSPQYVAGKGITILRDGETASPCADTRMD